MWTGLHQITFPVVGIAAWIFFPSAVAFGIW